MSVTHLVGGTCANHFVQVAGDVVLFGSHGHSARRLQVAAAQTQVDGRPEGLLLLARHRHVARAAARLLVRLLAHLMHAVGLRQAEVAADERERAKRATELGHLQVGVDRALDELAEAVLEIGDALARRAPLIGRRVAVHVSRAAVVVGAVVAAGARLVVQRHVGHEEEHAPRVVHVLVAQALLDHAGQAGQQVTLRLGLGVLAAQHALVVGVHLGRELHLHVAEQRAAHAHSSAAAAADAPSSSKATAELRLLLLLQDAGACKIPLENKFTIIPY